MSKKYIEFINLVKTINELRAIEMLLEWDQQTYMPAQGVKDRALQLSTLSTLIHDKLTSKKMGNFLEELQKPKVQEKLSKQQKANVREIAWEYHRAKAVPSKLVKEISKTKSESFNKWCKAKNKSDFKIFLPFFEKIVDLKKQEAEAIGYEEKLYDAFLDGFEPGFKSSEVENLFSGLEKKLVKIVSKIVEKGERPPTSFVKCGFPIDLQKKFNLELARKIGFDFERGRVDEAMHPFTAGTLHDTRITTRYDEKDIRPALFATIHEGGHALYEQGFLEEHYGTPMAQPVSFGIHESQSRMWENFIGRGMAFWQYFYPRLKKFFPKQFKDRSSEEFYFAINDVWPSLIRVQADEVTYNLHILLRYEIESAMFEDALEPRDTPQVWNEKIEKFFNLEVPNDSQGVLQDVHWSEGYFGYFPTYTLGNLYAAQFFFKAKKELPKLDEKIGKGEFSLILNWLRENIHYKGRLLRANDLVKEVTGKPLDDDFFISYIKEKFGKIYGF